MPDFSDESIRNAFLAAGALAVSCSLLSVFVVARRWAFMGEGISHSGFGGAGTCWLLATLFPGWFQGESTPYFFVFVFCFLTAIGIGWLVKSQRVTSDAAIGIFLVASLAWGFVGQHVYFHHYGKQPVGFDTLLWGQLKSIGNAYTISAVISAVVVAGLVWALFKEIIAYCFDPLLARTSGVKTTFIHYLLMLMLAMTIVVGSRIVGSVLVTALLVLPATTGNLISKRLSRSYLVGLIVSLVGVWGGLLISSKYRALPEGSTMVLVMVLEFAGALIWSRIAAR